MSDAENRAIVERFFAAQEQGDIATIVELTDDDMEMVWPQSGERFRGRDNVLGAMGAVEVRPEFAGEPRLVGSGSVWVLMVPLRYGDDVLQYVAVIELADGRVIRGTGYWASPFEAQPARAPFTDGG
jgi:ketosteroid isomerase-like protein